MIRILRAAFIAALFLLAAPGYSQTKAKKSETSQDIIEKAQNLILQRDRTQAINILSNAIKRESGRSQSVVELRKTLNEIAVLFFSDKAQQLYEVGITLKRTDLNQAQQKITEGLRMEPDNTLLLLEQARIAIAKNDCNLAEDIAVKSRLQNMYYEEMNLAYAQALLCQGKILEFQKAWDANDMKKSPLAKFWSILEAEKLFKDKSFTKASEITNSVQKMDAQYPEIQYWLWKIDQALKKKNPVAVEKYLMTCKNISAHLYRQYMMDPMLCRRTAEMEASGIE